MVDQIPCTWRSPLWPHGTCRPCPEPGTAGIADTGNVCRLHALAARGHGRLKLSYIPHAVGAILEMEGRIPQAQVDAWVKEYGRDRFVSGADYVKTHILCEYLKSEEKKP